MAGMADLITDDMLDHFAVVCRWDELADRLVERYDGIATRLIMYTAVEAIRTDPSTLGAWGEVAASRRVPRHAAVTAARARSSPHRT